jgi:hypothetical protein
MANPNKVGNATLDSFGYGRVGFVRNASLATAGLGIVTIPLNSGGLTNGGAVSNSGSVIIRQIVISDVNASAATANISISVRSTGNVTTPNVVVSNVITTQLTGVGTFITLNIAEPYLTNTAVSGAVTSALFLNVNTAVAATCDISVFGNVVSF